MQRFDQILMYALMSHHTGALFLTPSFQSKAKQPYHMSDSALCASHSSARLTVDDVRKVQGDHPERHTQSGEISHTDVPWQDIKDTGQTDDGRHDELWVVDGCHDESMAGFKTSS